MIYNIFSKRQKKLRNENPDVYQYNMLPNEFRIQTVHIFNDILGDQKDAEEYPILYEVFSHARKVLLKEYGKFYLRNKYDSPYQDIIEFFLNESDTERVLDVIEIIFKLTEHLAGKHSSGKIVLNDWGRTTQTTVKNGVVELNQRFKEHGIGYEYDNGKIIRIDSQVIHSEVIKPVLNLLVDKKFQGANEEFLKAHEHYRHKRYKECLNHCCPR